jgi:peptide/nickel transport system permease protein
MLQYVLKRILWFIPTLFAVTAIGFILLANAPGNPTNLLVSSSGSNGTIKNFGDIESQKTFWRKKLGLDLPLFYFSITKLSEPDTLYKIYDDQKLKSYNTLLNQTGNTSTIDNYFKNIENGKIAFENSVKQVEISKTKQLSVIAIETSLDALKNETNLKTQLYHLAIIKYYLKDFHALLPNFYLDLQASIVNLQSNTTCYKNYIPKIIWYGYHNQYHRWLFGGQNSKGIIRGDFGFSFIKKEPVISILKDKLIWSVFFSITSILLAYIISIPIGIKMSEKPNSSFTKVTQFILFILYCLPSFFVGVLLLMLFANPDILSIFPPSGVKPIEGYAANTSLLSKFTESFPYLILPLVCYTYSSLAFISKLTATSINKQLTLDYIKTATAKGLSHNKVIWKHALKNSILPLITVFSSIFPSIIGGSVIIESIFTIPGIGLETIRAIISQDYPIVIAIITLSSLLTIFSYLLADILYALVDPRIRTQK